ncbi:MAG TPA: FAD binding domain-containing protein [Anaerolineaceae bacterium]|nr:FAD binding domain-containing protein [Anaerolineaceae bacterium]
MTSSALWNEYYLARTLDEALALLGTFGPRARVIAGGTDLVLGLEEGKVSGVEILVDISRLPELKTVQADGERLTIGAGLTVSELQRSATVQAAAPILSEAAGFIAGRQIRNVATIGGNVVNGSPAADLTPALLVLDAVVSIAGQDGARRETPLERFLLGVRKVDLSPEELVLAFHMPRPAAGARLRFRKVQPRQAMAISILNLAVHLRLEAGCLTDVRLAMGAVAPTTVRLAAVERRLAGLPAADLARVDLAEALQADITPISDFRSSRDYRFRVAQRLLQAELLSAVEGIE